MAKWDEMTSRERDALIAEKIMGWKWHPFIWYDGSEKLILAPEEEQLSGDDFGWFDGDDVHLHVWELPQYTTDISAAWEVVEKMHRDERAMLHLVTGDIKKEDGWKPFYWAHFYNIETDYEYPKEKAEPAPEAICKAALKAVGVDIE